MNIRRTFRTKTCLLDDPSSFTFVDVGIYNRYRVHYNGRDMGLAILMSDAEKFEYDYEGLMTQPGLYIVEVNYKANPKVFFEGMSIVDQGHKRFMLTLDAKATLERRLWLDRLVDRYSSKSAFSCMVLVLILLAAFCGWLKYIEPDVPPPSIRTCILTVK